MYNFPLSPITECGTPSKFDALDGESQAMPFLDKEIYP